MTKNRPIASASAATIVNAHCALVIGLASAGAWALAEISSALRPMPIDCASATTPRITGQRSTRLRLVQETTGWDSTLISVFVRVATAQVDTPRIITPSRTAWPPTGASRCSGLLTHIVIGSPARGLHTRGAIYDRR